ncbi:MAG: glutamyl-tRNA reductase [Candidatus Omnitrophota bacterium]
MNYFTVGVNHKSCPLEVREKLFLGGARLERVLAQCASAFPDAEWLVLSTCNRTEIYGAFPAADRAVEAAVRVLEDECMLERDVFEPYLFFFRGWETVRHLFRVAAGLDSLVVGENEILGQLRKALQSAREAGTVRMFLTRMGEKALKAGKEIRSRTRLNRGAVSVPSVAVALAKKIFGKLAGEKVMVLGTGEMSVATLKCLQEAGAKVVTVVSRLQERGEAVAGQFGAEWIPLCAWESRARTVDILIAATGAPHTLIHEQQVREIMEARDFRPLFLIDIAVPRNINPSVQGIQEVYLYNIDDLKGIAAANLRARHAEIEKAEKQIQDAVTVFEQGFRRRALADFDPPGFSQAPDRVQDPLLS